MSIYCSYDTILLQVNTFTYDQYLKQLWKAVNTFVSNTLQLTVSIS